MINWRKIQSLKSRARSHFWTIEELCSAWTLLLLYSMGNWHVCDPSCTSHVRWTSRQVLWGFWQAPEQIPNNEKNLKSARLRIAVLRRGHCESTKKYQYCTFLRFWDARKRVAEECECRCVPSQDIMRAQTWHTRRVISWSNSTRVSSEFEAISHNLLLLSESSDSIFLNGL